MAVFDALGPFQRLTALRRGVFVVARVPHLDGAAAVLLGRNRALELGVVQRMILGRNRQSLGPGSVEGPRGTAQDLRTPSTSSRKSNLRLTLFEWHTRPLEHGLTRH